MNIIWILLKDGFIQEEGHEIDPTFNIESEEEEEFEEENEDNEVNEDPKDDDYIPETAAPEENEQEKEQIMILREVYTIRFPWIFSFSILFN